jgi:hypothetical protein
MIYTPLERKRLDELEAEIGRMEKNVRYWKQSNCHDIAADCNRELLALLKEFNALLDKQSINQP